MDTRAILTPNSEFERKQELNRLFYSNQNLSKEEVDVLNSCTTEDHECIGLIGCILKDQSDVNKARLIIATHNHSNIDLATKAEELLSCTENELEELINTLADVFLLEENKKSTYEDKIYSTLFHVIN
jgi:hypothetical protein